MKQHHYETAIEWTGNKGVGTSNYNSYNRSHVISGIEKAINIPGSSDPSFSGDKTKYNPEELFVSSLSACHMLWYLHLCSINNIVVTNYSDKATGIMIENENGGGKFESVTLNPVVKIENMKNAKVASLLHNQANEMCFIANSCNFGVKHNATIIEN